MSKMVSRENTERVCLYEKVPLDGPYKVVFFLGDVCNLKCKYCVHSLTGQKYKDLALTRNFMEWDTFVKIANDLKEFSSLKTILIAGCGEPTLHPDLVQMIRYLKDKEVAKQVNLVTNAIWGGVTNKKIDELIATGIDRIEVSIQGNNSEDYLRNAGRKIDYELFFSNLQYLFSNKKQCTIYMQSLEENFNTEEDKQTFLEKYGKVCDLINIAPTLPLDDEVDFSYLGNVEAIRKKNWREVCPQVFYQLSFLSDGTVIPCCHSLRGRRLSLGNVKDESLLEIWNGEKRRNFLLTQLRIGRSQIEACKTCLSPNQCNPHTDVLDNHQDEIIERILENRGN